MINMVSRKKGKPRKISKIDIGNYILEVDTDAYWILHRKNSQLYRTQILKCPQKDGED